MSTFEPAVGIYLSEFVATEPSTGTILARIRREGTTDEWVLAAVQVLRDRQMHNPGWSDFVHVWRGEVPSDDHPQDLVIECARRLLVARDAMKGALTGALTTQVEKMVATDAPG